MAKFVQLSWEFMEVPRPKEMLRLIEKAARTCYKSEDKTTLDSDEQLIRSCIKNGHESVLEHAKLTVKIVCDRGTSHELVRHRIASYSQESIRYCNYSTGKFGSELTFVEPTDLTMDKLCTSDATDKRIVWEDAMNKAEQSYLHLVKLGAKTDICRGVLPTDIKTEIAVTMNMREWRHFFKLRCSKKAHPNIRYIAKSILYTFYQLMPCLFEDIYNDVFGKVKTGEAQSTEVVNN